MRPTIEPDGEFMSEILFSIVVLTFNRVEVVAELLEQLAEISRYDVEILVVDNGSTDGTSDFVSLNYQKFRLIRSEVNLGAVGRNLGIAEARGKYVVTIDDDILYINSDSLTRIKYLFDETPSIGAICFKVLDFYSSEICNWCHPKRVEDWKDIPFETNEITEGAVVFRNEMLEKTGYYTEPFVISHEGADLAARIIESGYEIHYTPLVQVKHKYASEARDRWRRYYYDTRNNFWLVIRNYHILFAISYLCRRLPVTFIYSLRDGYLNYWMKAVWDAVREMPLMCSQRKPVSFQTQRKLRLLNKQKPGFLYYFTKRFFSKQVRI